MVAERWPSICWTTFTSAPDAIARLAADAGEDQVVPLLAVDVPGQLGSEETGVGTSRRRWVLVVPHAGRTKNEIAEELYLSLSTVKTYIGALMHKFSARNRVEIVIWAYESGRIDTGRNH